MYSTTLFLKTDIKNILSDYFKLYLSNYYSISLSNELKLHHSIQVKIRCTILKFSLKLENIKLSLHMIPDC